MIIWIVLRGDIGKGAYVCNVYADRELAIEKALLEISVRGGEWVADPNCNPTYYMVWTSDEEFLQIVRKEVLTK